MITSPTQIRRVTLLSASLAGALALTVPVQTDPSC